MKVVSAFPVFLVLTLFIFSDIKSQEKYFTKSGRIIFDATAKNSPEKIDAVNGAVTCVFDTKTGNIQFAVLMKGFQFERALMQEHFNENYVESDKYPRSEFKGTIHNPETFSTMKDGVYPVVVKGKLTIHGVSREIESKGIITVKNGSVGASSSFDINLQQYNISIPQLVADKLSPNVKITMDCNLQPLKG